MNSRQLLERHFGHLGSELIDEIEKSSQEQTFEPGAVLLKEGQYVRVIPLVLEGLIKVITKYEDREFLVYYIEPDQTCIMSFAACLSQEPSRIMAVVEEPTRAILLPVDLVTGWIKQYPNLNSLFFNMYQLRYNDLLSTINHLLFDRLDKRIMDYLQQRKLLKGSVDLKITHRQIANEVGTSREVVTRILHKLEEDGQVKQLPDRLKIL